jgi:hypothetical protein
MKKTIVAIALIAFSCDEGDDNSPVFRIEDPFFESRFERFVEIAEHEDFGMTVPRNNMILRFVQDDDTEVNDSKAYRQGDQLYIDIDEKFIDVQVRIETHITIILYHNLANGLFGTPFRDCGIMKKVVTPDDLPEDAEWGWGDYPALFDPNAPC